MSAASDKSEVKRSNSLVNPSATLANPSKGQHRRQRSRTTTDFPTTEEILRPLQDRAKSVNYLAEIPLPQSPLKGALSFCEHAFKTSRAAFLVPKALCIVKILPEQKSS